MATNDQPLKRLATKAVKKAEDFAQQQPEKCLALALTADLPPFVEKRHTRDFSSNKVVVLFDLFAEMAGVKKQALAYQETRAALIEKKFGKEPIAATSITIPSVTKLPKMVEKELPGNVLDFKKIVEPIAPSDSPALRK